MSTEVSNADIRAVIGFVKGQMAGETPPATGSAAEQTLSEAVGRLLRHKNPQELEWLGLLAVQTVIEHMRSSIAASSTLQRFIRGGLSD